MEDFKVPTLPLPISKAEDTNNKKEGNKIKPDENEITTQPKVLGAAPSPLHICPYKIPSWSTLPPAECEYNFEVLKSGLIIEKVKDLQKKAFWTFGRLPENDVEMAHPTISRFHAILQYSPKSKKENDKESKEEENKEELETKIPAEGWYVYDMGSTHGTFLNKQRIPSNMYIRIRVGHILRLGASSRIYILQGPPEDEEPESELSVTELKAKRQQELEEAAAEKQRKILEAEERLRTQGCSWGMAEDADAETDLTHNPYASTNNEELFLDDPKKTLRGFFEREGLQLEYKCDEMSVGSFVCRVELPVDDSNGRPIVAEVVHKGRKKECVVQCALEACRILDRHGMLRQANQEPQKRKIKSKSDSDDDEFWDRTGDVARKRQKKVNVGHSVALTHDDLIKQEQDVKEQLNNVQANIIAYQDQQKRLKAQKQHKNDDLDSYMENLKQDEPQRDKIEIRKLRLEEQRLKVEQQRVQRLIKLTKPISFTIADHTAVDILKSQVQKKQLPMIGKRNQFSKFKVITTATHKTEQIATKALASDEEEMDEDEEGVKNESKNPEQIPAEIKIVELSKENREEETKEEIIPKTNGPAVTPANNLDREDTNKETENKEEEKEEEKSPSSSNDLNASTVEDGTCNEDNITKKRRCRVRQRCKRAEVDIDDNDEHYDPTGKYAKWIPPDNQTGDGFTQLNKKYGY